MVRPKRMRRVKCEPGVSYFKPAGIRMRDLKEVVVSVDEYEAVRLKDYEELSQEDAAKEMNVSQPTFHRTLQSARKKISDAVINGKALRIDGGNYELKEE